VIEVRSPATGEVVASVPELGAAELTTLAGRARAAQPGWHAMGFDGRGAILRRLAR
jgi:acyl-CoA reductase-like NAD-dependent aldehyde dehydrogenase